MACFSSLSFALIFVIVAAFYEQVHAGYSYWSGYWAREYESKDPTYDTSESTIYDIVCSNDEFSTLCAYMDETGLNEILSGGEFTLFAPTNEAFERLEKNFFTRDIVDELLGDTESLKEILTYHVVPNATLYADQLQNNANITMANELDTETIWYGNRRLFQKGTANLGNAMPEVVVPNIKASNGIVHTITRVLRYDL